MTAVMDMDGLDDDEHNEDMVKFCPHCDLPLYPKDSKKIFFLLICRSCAYEAQLDYEISWENKTVNGVSILPPVKLQGAGACLPNAVITVAESKLILHEAMKKKRFTDKLSVEDLIEKYEKDVYCEDEKNVAEFGMQLTGCMDVMQTLGVVTKQGNDSHRFKSYMKYGLTFTDICELLLKKQLQVTGIPITPQFKNLRPDEIYIADKKNIKIAKDGKEEWHAIVLVGFGIRNNEKYFRFMNSHGTKFCDKGFGSIRALEVKNVLWCELEG